MDYNAVETRVLKEKLERLKKINFQLNEDNARLRRDNTHMRKPYEYYMLIQNACQANVVVADEFSRFLITCRLTEESEEGTPGLTTEDDKQHGFDFYND